MQIQLSHIQLFFLLCLCLHVGVPVEVPEEPFDKLLLLRLSVVDDGHSDGSGVVLVFWQADGSDLLSSLLIALRPIEGFQVLKKLGLCADTSLGSLHTYFVTSNIIDNNRKMLLTSAHLKKIIWRPNILVMGLLLREVAGQLSASSWQSS